MRVPLAELDPIGRPITREELRRNCGYRTKAEAAADPWPDQTGVLYPQYTIEQLMNTDWMQRRGIYSR